MKGLKISIPSNQSLSDDGYPNQVCAIPSVPSWMAKNGRSHSTIRRIGRIEEQVRFPKAYQGLYNCQFSRNGEMFAAVFGGGAIQVYTRDGVLEHTFREANDDLHPVTCVHFSPRDSNFFYASDMAGFVYKCNMKKENMEVFVREAKNEINSFDITQRTGTMMITGGKDAVMRLYDINTRKLVHKYQPTKDTDDSNSAALFHKLRIFKVKCHPQEENVLLTGGWDNCVKVWDIRIHNGCVQNIRGPQVYGDAIDIRDTIMVTGSYKPNGGLEVWDLRNNGQLLQTIDPVNRLALVNGEYINCLQYLKGDFSYDTVVSSTCTLNVLELISLSEKKVICSFKSSRIILAMDNLDNRIVFGGLDPIIRIAKFETKKYYGNEQSMSEISSYGSWDADANLL